MNSEEYILQMKCISKEFPGVKALDGVSLNIKKGTVHAVIGENGAGKSTLMKILIGIYQPDQGEILYKGKAIKISNSHEAIKLGISMIHQELNPVLELSVSENIFLGREPLNRITGFVSEKELFSKTQELFETLDIKGISPKSKMKSLSIAQIQMIEIAKAVSYNSDLIIMDEPTSALTEAEVTTLFNIIVSLKAKGIAIIYISHKLDEIFKISDEITVMRDGQYIDTVKTENVTREKLISMMVGRELKDFYRKQATEKGEVALEVRNLTKEGLFKDISFKVHKGEILGIAGLVGAGRTEIVETIFGMRGSYSGEIYKDGKRIFIRNERDAIKNKIALATEDRKALGLVLCLPVRHNISMAWLKMLSKFSLVQTKKEKNICEELVKTLRIKLTNIDCSTNTLSGGNQQKVVLAKWLLTSPDVLILDEPTRGIDVGAKAEIYGIMVDLAKQGKAIIMISSEMPELIGMSDRIIVVHDGAITGELSREEATQEAIMGLASI